MKRLEQMIDMARKLSGNTSYGPGSGITQDVFVQYFNNAQDSLSKEVINLKTKFLKKFVNVPVVSGQERYDYPYDCYMQHIDTIQPINQNGSIMGTPLTKSYTKEKLSNRTGFPYGYILQNDGWYLNPPINNGVLQVTYSKFVPRLQKKNGQITTATVVAGTLTALTVSTAGAYDSDEINLDYFLCVVDKHGVQKARNIEYSSQAAGVFTLNPQAIGEGQSINVGDFIVIGKNTTNQPEWPDVCESYLIKHAVYDAKYTDASTWSDEAKKDMTDFFISLSGSFATLSDDISEIPITNFDYL